jgi:hypothetical protein
MHWPSREMQSLRRQRSRWCGLARDYLRETFPEFTRFAARGGADASSPSSSNDASQKAQEYARAARLLMGSSDWAKCRSLSFRTSTRRNVGPI